MCTVYACVCMYEGIVLYIWMFVYVLLNFNTYICRSNKVKNLVNTVTDLKVSGHLRSPEVIRVQSLRTSERPVLMSSLNTFNKVSLLFMLQDKKMFLTAWALIFWTIHLRGTMPVYLLTARQVGLNITLPYFKLFLHVVRPWIGVGKG